LDPERETLEQVLVYQFFDAANAPAEATPAMEAV